MKMIRKRRWIALALCACMLFCVAGCGSSAIKSEDLMAGVEAGKSEITENPEPTKAPEKAEETGEAEQEELSRPITDFGVSLLQAALKNSDSDSNVLVSPLSVLMALAMTANGAEGETKAQMEAVLGEHLNEYLRDYRQKLPRGEKYKLNLANAIWFKNDENLAVQEEFLQTNADYYNAAVYKAAFDDTTLKDINNWVEKNTDGMIENILDKISEDAVLYLVNALSFDAEWQSIYRENQVRDGVFTKEDGTVQQVEMMYSEEYTYLEDEKATGFLKYYSGRKYAFVALLPKEGITVADYVETLTGEHLAELLKNPSAESVYAGIPKFETEYSVTLNDVLVQMGMTDAFDPMQADFTSMATVPPDRNIYISRVLHKTFISVDEKGTKAGAATVVEMMKTTSARREDPKQVYLDRPFVYLLIDCENNEPFFMGTMMDMEK